MSRISRYKLVNPFTFRNSIESGDGDTTVVFSGGLGEFFGAYASDGGGVASRSGSLFNNVFADGTSKHFKFQDTNSAQEIFTINFNKKINAPNVKIVTHTRLSETFSFRLNDDANLDSGVLQGNTSGNTVKSNEVIFNLSNHNNQLSKIVFTMEDAVGTTHEIHEIQIFVDEGSVPFEFNDSLLSSKAWNSSRYDGRQLQASQLNVARKSDIGNNDKNPILQNYSRNIYIGNAIKGMSSTPEDPNITQFHDYSYAQIEYYVTVNDDDSLTENRIEANKVYGEGEENISKKGWYRAFYDDFPEKSRCKLILGDQSVTNNIRSSYPIYFNGGQLKRVFIMQSGNNQSSDATFLTVLTGSAEFYPHIINGFGISSTSSLGDTVGGTVNLAGLITGTTSSLHTASLYNQEIYQNFYTGSLAGPNFVFGSGEDETTLLSINEVQNFLEGFNDYKANSNYKGDKRMFVTLCRKGLRDDILNPLKGNTKPVYTYEEGGYPPASASVPAQIAQRTVSLPTLATFEIDSINKGHSKVSVFSNDEIILSPRTKPSFNYSSFRDSINGQPTPTQFRTGSYLFSLCEDDNPSLLIPLKKEQALPEGIGDKPFVVIPDNLHPYIKDNLTHFLIKAGIDIGDRKETPVLKEKNKPKVRRRLSAAERLARRLAFEAERERRMLPKKERERRRRRQEREERREDRQERREERREDRQERRQERREDRQERRRNRRRNRRRRR